LRIDDLLSPFHSEFGEFFGFGEAIRKAGESLCFLHFEARVPDVITKTGLCTKCGGKGEMEDGMKCHYCSEGVAYTYNWHDAYALCASMNLLFMLMDEGFLATPGMSPGFDQLCGVTTCVVADRGGFDLGGQFGEKFVDWLCRVEAHPSVMSAIRESLSRLYISLMHLGTESYLSIDDHQTRVDIDDGYLTITVPGDAACIHADRGRSRTNEGYSFYSHNIDHPGQQITLLAGLGLLQGQYLKDLGIIHL